MIEVPAVEKDLRFRSVTVHGDGQKLNGTLYLHRHHFSFTYYVDAPKKSLPPREITENGTQTSGESYGLTDASATSNGASVSVGNGTPENARHTSAQSQTKQRPRELWVPYPLIYSCTLRPSHAPIHSSRPRDESGHAMDGEEDLFPPTFGTATYERPSTDSARLAPYSSPSRPASPGRQSTDVPSSQESGRQPAIRIKCRDFKMMALHFHETQLGPSADEVARQVFHVLRSRGCVSRVEDMHAFHFRPPKEETAAHKAEYDARREYARMGISGKSAEGPGAAWRITDINQDYSYSPTYPKVLCVPKTVSDNTLKHGGAFRSKSRIPCLSYLHSNGGSITRSSQPMVGVQSKRSPQDERLVSAIFSSHTSPISSAENSSLSAGVDSAVQDDDPESSTNNDQAPPGVESNEDMDNEDDTKAKIPQKRIYGSTRQNLIVDARPRVNAYVNRAGGGGVENVSKYTGNSGLPVELIYLNIANIHVMRESLAKVVESFANSDYIKVKPNESLLRNSGWLGHITNMLDGAETIARMIGLGGSHVLLHCSDGWDRTAQISALAQIMLDPYARTLEGFITLVQKDFMSFGHKFRHRDGIEGCEKWYDIENERIAPRDGSSSDPNALNKFGTKAFTGARNWFEKSRGNLFRQQNDSRSSLGEQTPPRSSSPPPNSVVHSPPNTAAKEAKKHKMDETEVSPVFHQFLDAVYQLLYQSPDAFEFSERFLRRLFFHVYSCQYGEFLFNNEKERSEYQGRLPSVWPYFLSRKAEFANPDYIVESKDPLLFPKRRGFDREIEARWWHTLFGRKDEEMNVPRALAPADPPAVTPALGTSASFDEQNAPGKTESTDDDTNGAIKEAKSAPNLSSLRSSITNSLSSLGLRGGDGGTASMAAHETRKAQDDEVALSGQAEASTEQSGTQTESKRHSLPQMEQMEFDGDPLGVTSSESNKTERSGLDFAAFASQNAFHDR